MKWVTGLVVALSAILATPATAESCSGYAQACARNETALGRSASRCEGPRVACLKSCKGGHEGVYISPSRHIHFPVTECR